MTKDKMFVKKEDNIAEVISKFPESAEVFLAFGLHCVGCFANSFDSIEAGAQIHGMSDEELDEMVSEVNYIINSNNNFKKPKKSVEAKK